MSIQKITAAFGRSKGWTGEKMRGVMTKIKAKVKKRIGQPGNFSANNSDLSLEFTEYVRKS